MSISNVVSTYTNVNGRRENQDSYAAALFEAAGHTGILALVADGVGGEGPNGRLASIGAGQTFLDLVATGNVTDAQLVQAVAYAHQKAREAAGNTTLTVLRAYMGRYTIVHVGDSRAYMLKAGAQALQLTRDHSKLAELRERGVEITPQIHAKYRSSITRGLGHRNSEKARPDTYVGEYSASDSFLLCSDGFWHEFERENNYLPGNAQTGLETLAGRAIANGESDNITAILINAGALL